MRPATGQLFDEKLLRAIAAYGGWVADSDYVCENRERELSRLEHLGLIYRTWTISGKGKRFLNGEAV